MLKTNRKTIYEAIARKEIPALRIGRLLRIPGAWLNRAASMTEPSEAGVRYAPQHHGADVA